VCSPASLFPQEFGWDRRQALAGLEWRTLPHPAGTTVYLFCGSSAIGSTATPATDDMTSARKLQVNAKVQVPGIVRDFVAVALP